MKFIAQALILSLVTFSAFASQPKIHCRGIENSLYEVIIQKGKKMTAGQVRALPAGLKKKIAGAEQVHSYEMVIFRGEATPQSISAVGAESDVYLQVFSVTGPEKLSLYLDEIGPQDISSTLDVDLMKLDMSCREI